jgi:hypothetical protein
VFTCLPVSKTVPKDLSNQHSSASQTFGTLFSKRYNIISQPSTGKENEMLQQVTIQTSNLEQFKSMLKTALEREAKLLEYSIERTRQALARFEARYQMSSDEFERKFKNREIEETLDFLDWWMEVEALRHLEARRNLIKDARVE